MPDRSKFFKVFSLSCILAYRIWGRVLLVTIKKVLVEFLKHHPIYPELHFHILCYETPLDHTHTAEGFLILRILVFDEHERFEA